MFKFEFHDNFAEETDVKLSSEFKPDISDCIEKFGVFTHVETSEPVMPFL